MTPVASSAPVTDHEDAAREPAQASEPLLITVGSVDGAVVPGAIVELGEELMIGRALPDGGASWASADRLISGRHAQVRRRGREIVLRDLWSRNGTWVDGRRIEGETTLDDGATLVVGGTAAVLRWVGPDERRAIAEEAVAPLGPTPTASPALALRLRRLRRSALAEGELLLVGPTGAGKEIYARAVHALARGKGPFVAVNCAALPAELVESELFGYTRGAHSQASVPKAGLVEAADGGTLFLDEIGDMPREAQAKLLRFLQFREFSPLGATRSRRIDVRIVAATSELRILDTASGPGRGLRRDLASRLGAEPVVLPALRERPEDLLTLAAAGRGGVLPRLTPAALRTLLAYPWPGNVRELAKAIDEATAQSLDEGVVDLRHLPSTILQPAAPPRPVLRRRRAPPRDELEALLRRHEGRVADVARALNRRWSVVWRWLVRHGLEPDDFRVRPGGPVMASRQSRG